MALETYLKNYKSTKDGLIINIASIGGIGTVCCNAVYMATKSAVINYGRNHEKSYDQNKIRVVTVCPGLTDTPILDNFFERTFPSDHAALEEILSKQIKAP